MTTAYRYARNPSLNGTSTVPSTAINVYKPGTTTAVTLYADPSLVQTIANPPSTDVNGFLEFYTAGVDTVDLNWSTTTLSAQPLGKVDNVYAPLSTTGGLVPAYATPDLYALEGSPTALYRSNIPRIEAGINLSALTTQVMLSTAMWLPAGTVVTNLTFVSGVTAAGTPTNWWFALYSSAATPALLAQSADQTSTAWAAETPMTLALSAPVTIATSGVYYPSIMVKATTVPTLAGVGRAGAGASAAVITGNKILAQTSGSSLTATAPATITSATTVGTIPLVIVT